MGCSWSNPWPQVAGTGDLNPGSRHDIFFFRNTGSRITDGPGTSRAYAPELRGFSWQPID
jgi:hypothetical protein